MFFTNDSMISILANHGLRTPPGVLIEGAFRFEDPCRLAANCILQYSSIGAYSYIMHNVQLEHVQVGRYCSIARNVLCLGSTHPSSSLSTSPVLYDKTAFSWRIGDMAVHDPDPPRKIQIGHDVWIGANAFLSPGVKIGQGAVIGANAVVTKDVEPYMIVAGTPARVIRARFAERTIERILALNWAKYDIPSWMNSGAMPDPRDVDDNKIEIFERAVLSGSAPLLDAKSYNLYRSGPGKISIDRV